MSTNIADVDAHSIMSLVVDARTGHTMRLKLEQSEDSTNLQLPEQRLLR